MVGVQLIGKDSVIAAYNDVDVDTWAILQGKQLIVSGEGEGNLSVWLDRFGAGGSAAIYTLRCYDTESLPDSLTAGTNFVAAFNFKFTEIYQPAGMGGYNSQLIGRIDELEKKLAAKQESEEEGPDFLSAVMGWFEDPHKLQQAVGAFKMLMGNAANAMAAAPAPQGLAGFDGARQKFESEEQKIQRLSIALDRLEKKDPDIVEHLEKLADIAEKKPDTFKFLISNLSSI